MQFKQRTHSVSERNTNFSLIPNFYATQTSHSCFWMYYEKWIFLMLFEYNWRRSEKIAFWCVCERVCVCVCVCVLIMHLLQGQPCGKGQYSFSKETFNSWVCVQWHKFHLDALQCVAVWFCDAVCCSALQFDSVSQCAAVAFLCKDANVYVGIIYVW